MASPESASEPVEEYLDKLLLTLPGKPRQVRHTLAEVQDHLHDAVQEGLAAGLTQEDAELAAIGRIGPLGAVTGRGSGFARPAAALIRRTALAGSLVGGVALVAVGLSGFIVWLLARTHSGSFVTAPFPPGSYTAADCARWLAGDPRTHNCVTAMIADHVGDIMLQRFAAGVLGVIVLGLFAVMRRRWQDRSTLTALPVGSAEGAGALLAGLVAVVTLGMAVDAERVLHGQGAGQLFSLAVAALFAAGFFASRFWWIVRRPASG